MVSNTAPRSLILLGSTGSIGTQALDIVDQHPGCFTIRGLTSYRSVERLIAQAKKYRPAAVAIADTTLYTALKEGLAGESLDIYAGPEAVQQIAAMGADVTISAITGIAALLPTMRAIAQGGIIGLANKEGLVCSGPLMRRAAEASKATIIPIDSEHNGLFQLFQCAIQGPLERVIITASGGPFRTWKYERIARATVTEAVTHPVWSMGAKISIDSATLANKVLECIEAKHLFTLAAHQVEAVIHPEVIVHALVGYRDGTMLAQLAVPDMRLPISTALAWPERLSNGCPLLTLEHMASLHFSAPDITRFPHFGLMQALLKGELSASIIFNAANEVAVAQFLAGSIPFYEMFAQVERALTQVTPSPITSIEDVMALDRLTREWMVANAR